MVRITEVDGRIRLNVKVLPRSSRNGIAGEEGETLKVKLNAPPVDGEANKALTAFLADMLGVPKKDVVIVKGETARHKVVEIRGIDALTCRQIIGQKITG
ncbi:hypothetical protein SAMN02745221_00332 [Thermosyntropha lipolytica DSM 11003]|uniref:UPF0235 protein SAMN02745221_00332 n=1 Tax=Thermosyntropha lipolytica DSM 11003 TaxID=1123382 RepID=A0A1M5KAN6_9FIRM|nr:DUF167 domain-containing protein [Thermosyntropha lipolytica]SHG49243.1 hypothetical protein SAMN02745221_00332 [Thermosyntropha lipolytica DSM 11003]